MKTIEIRKGDRLYASLNVDPRANGWERSKNRWMMVEVVQTRTSHPYVSLGEVRDRDIEEVIKRGEKQRGDAFLVVTVDSDKDAGEPGYYKAGRHFLVKAGQLFDKAGYERRTQAARDAVEQQERQRQEREAETRRVHITYESGAMELLIQEEGINGSHAELLRRLVSEGKIDTGRYWSPTS